MEFTPPSYPNNKNKSVFLAGSIEMGLAEEWQKKFIADLTPHGFDFFNPRRPDWDSSWKQSKDDDNFSTQVNWELDHLEKADYVVMYFDPNTKSPISLLELGLFKNKKNFIVCCPEGFWRKGNVDIVCERYGIKQVNTITELAYEIINTPHSGLYRFKYFLKWFNATKHYGVFTALESALFNSKYFLPPDKK